MVKKLKYHFLDPICFNKRNCHGRHITNRNTRMKSQVDFLRCGICVKAKELNFYYFDEELKKYKEKFGHASVPNPENKDDEYKSLGNWVHKIRCYRRNWEYNRKLPRNADPKDYKQVGPISHETIQKLDDIEFVWNHKPQSICFDARFNELVAFKNIHGHVNVPTTSYSSLGRWCKGMRYAYRLKKAHESNPNDESLLTRMKKSYNLNETKIKRLTDIGFDFGNTNTTTPISIEMNESDEKCDAGNNDDGDLYLDQELFEEPPTTQATSSPSDEKSNLDGREDKGSAEGVAFFEHRLEELKKYKEKFGRMPKPHPKDEEDEYKSLNRYVKKIRRYHRNWEYNQKLPRDADPKDYKPVGPISDKTIQKLDELGFIWTYFELRLEELKEYKEKFGHTSVSQNNKSLGRWVCEIRSHRRNWEYNQKLPTDGDPKDRKPVGEISPETIKMLDDIEFVWTQTKRKKKF